MLRTVHAAFRLYDPVARRMCPLPDGVLVRAWDRDLVDDDPLGEARTVDGVARIEVASVERRPDVYLEVVGEGRGVEAGTGRLLDGPEAGVVAIALPDRWTSLGRTASDFSPGLIRGARADIGTAEAPWTFRLSFDAWLRLAYWDPVTGAYLGVPAGVVVEALARRGFGGVVLGRGETGPDGTVHLELAAHQPRPSLYFRARVPTEVQDAATVGLPAAWDSRAGHVLERPGRSGYWTRFEGSHIGRPDSPYVFDVAGAPPGLIPGNHAEPLIGGHRALAAIERAIASARHTVHVEVMFFFDDEIGRHLAELLAAKAREGVTVRVLYDKRTTADVPRHTLVSRLWATRFLELEDAERAELVARIDATRTADAERADTTALRQLLIDAGVEVRDSAFPYVELLPTGDDGLPPALRALEDGLPAINLGRVDHRKMVIVDGRLAILGGMNFGREYLFREPIDPTLDAAVQASQSTDEPWEKWQDAKIALRGPVVREVQRLFREQWALVGGELFDLGPADLGRGTDPNHPTFPALEPQPGGVPVRIVDTTPGARFRVHQTLLALLDGARREVWISNPYFNSDELEHHLLAAARRGVRVVYLMPGIDHNDSLDFVYAARVRYARWLEAGVELYELRHHMTHAKVAVIDNVALIGSANLNHSSFYRHYEVVASVHDAAFAAQVKAELFHADLAHATRIHAADLPELLDMGLGGRVWLGAVVAGNY